MKRNWCFLSLGILALLVSACAGQPARSDGSVAPGPADKPTALIGDDAAGAVPSGSRVQVAEKAGQSGSVSSGYAAAAGAGAPAPAAPEQAQQSDRMIVYNASVSLEVETVGDAVNAVRTLAEGSGGIVAGASTRFQGESEYATLTLRVPSGEYNRVMSRLREMAVKVVSENGSARDVTEEFSDLGAQLRNYEATEAQYLELLRRANTIDEILKVQAKLTEVRGQIERAKGRMNLLQKTSDMATIVVTLAPVGKPAGPKKPLAVWDPARSAQEAWEGSLRVVQVVADAGIRVLVFSWWLMPVGFLAWALWSGRRRPVGTVEA